MFCRGDTLLLTSEALEVWNVFGLFRTLNIAELDE